MPLDAAGFRMHPDRTAFLRAVIADPADDVLRLVYADWLDEHGEPVGAALQRVLANPADDGYRLAYADAVGGERAEFIRVQCALAAIDAAYGPRSQPGAGLSVVVRVTTTSEDALRRRERELWDVIGPGLTFAWDTGPNGQGRPHLSDMRRGFVEHVSCTAADAMTHLHAVRREHPVTAVRLTTWLTVADVVHEQVGPHSHRYRFRDCVACDWHYESASGANPILGLLARTFPGVTFKFPPVPDPRLTAAPRMTAR